VATFSASHSVDGSGATLVIRADSIEPTVLRAPAGRPILLHVENTSGAAVVFELPAETLAVSIPNGGAVDAKAITPVSGGFEFYTVSGRSRGVVGALMGLGAKMSAVQPAPPAWFDQGSVGSGAYAGDPTLSSAYLAQNYQQAGIAVGWDGGRGGPKCAPSGTTLRLTARYGAFWPDCLAVVAGHPFTIVFRNADAGVTHDVSIYSGPLARRRLFRGAAIAGPGRVSLRVPALKAGDYFFRCDMHPTQMEGKLMVGAP
jgi:plastocyanin